MPNAQTTETTAPLELTNIASIRARYALPGPHATAVVQVPTPRTVGDDLNVRWNSVASDLVGLGAPADTVDRMADALASTRRRGHPLLLTANDDSAACCWLGFDVASSIRVGTLPALLPAIHQAALEPAQIVGAVIDRTGADVYSVGAFDITAVASVEGDDELIHKSAAGGMSQARYQRHSEVIWARNAELIAAAIDAQAARPEAHAIVLTGDEREVRLVEAQLDDGRARTVCRVQAGGRHEPRTPERLFTAAAELRAELHDDEVARALADVREELGQKDQAVAGAVAVLEAIKENRVKILFVDMVVGARTPHIDATISAALDHGTGLVTGHDFNVPDGVAGLLRIPYSSPNLGR